MYGVAILKNRFLTLILFNKKIKCRLLVLVGHWCHLKLNIVCKLNVRQVESFTLATYTFDRELF